MNNLNNPKENRRAPPGRESFSGRLLTDHQFEDTEAIVGIVARRIQNTGAFKDVLGDFAFAFARSEKALDTAKAEIILRDLFKEITGQTMNQFREELVKNEEAITDDHRAQAYSRACEIPDVMQSGVKITFHRAFAQQARQFAEEHGVTDACAKRLMCEEFANAENADIYDWGKELDAQFYRPQIEAEKAEREAARTPPEKSQQQSRPRFRTRSGPQ